MLDGVADVMVECVRGDVGTVLASNAHKRTRSCPWMIDATPEELLAVGEEMKHPAVSALDDMRPRPPLEEVRCAACADLTLATERRRLDGASRKRPLVVPECRSGRILGRLVYAIAKRETRRLVDARIQKPNRLNSARGIDAHGKSSMR
jgi:hypothetical protein